MFPIDVNRVLVIGVDRHALSVIGATFAAGGIREFHICPSIVEAFSVIYGLKPDCVMLEHRDSDKLGLVKIIGRILPRIPIVLYGYEFTEQAVRKAMQAGVADVIRFPVSIPIIAHRLGRALPAWQEYTLKHKPERQSFDWRAAFEEYDIGETYNLQDEYAKDASLTTAEIEFLLRP